MIEVAGGVVIGYLVVTIVLPIIIGFIIAIVSSLY